MVTREPVEVSAGQYEEDMRTHGVQSRLAGGAWAISRLVQVPLLNPVGKFSQNALPICGHLQPSYDPKGNGLVTTKCKVVGAAAVKGCAG